MKTYVKLVNPLLSICIFLLCLWAAFFEDGNFRPAAVLKGGIPTYFLAKGLFCSSALFLVGKIVALMSEEQPGSR